METFISVILTALSSIVLHEIGYYLSDVETKKHLGRYNISHLIFGFLIFILSSAFIIIFYKILSSLWN